VPLTDKGKKILGAMKNTYGKEKGESVFYAMENKEQTKMMNNTKKPAGAMGKALGHAKQKAGKGLEMAKSKASDKAKGLRGMAMGGVSAAAKAGGKAYGTGVAEGKQRMGIGMAKGGMAKKKAK
jgi:hypothetical protein